MSGIKIKNFDSTGEMPAPDDRGRLILVESNRNVLGVALPAFVFGCLGACSGVVLLGLDHGIVPRDKKTMETIWISFGLSILVFPFLCTMLLCPLRLTIDDDGVALRKLGVTGRIAWQDLLEVKLTVLPISTNYSTIATETIMGLKGRAKSLSWDTDFRVKPEILGMYLKHRAERISGQTVRFVNDPSPEFVQLATNETKAKRAMTTVVWFVVLFGVVVLIVIMSIQKIFYPQIRP